MNRSDCFTFPNHVKKEGISIYLAKGKDNMKKLLILWLFLATVSSGCYILNIGEGGKVASASLDPNVPTVLIQPGY